MAETPGIIIYAGKSVTRFATPPTVARKKCTLSKLYIALYPGSRDCENDTTRVEDLVSKKATVTADCDGNSTPTTLGEVWEAILNHFDPAASNDAAGLWMVVNSIIRLSRDRKRKATAGGKRTAADMLQQVRLLPLARQRHNCSYSDCDLNDRSQDVACIP